MSIEQGKIVFAAATAEISGVSGSAPTPIFGGGAAEIVIPGGNMLLHADFSRAGADLLITAPDGSQFIIVDYFNGESEAGLMTESGALLPFDLVSILAGPVAPGQYAQEGDGLDSAPIGRVDETVGEATATRVDGTTVTLAKDSPVFQGDILETGAGGAVAVVFIDETEFSLGEDGRMVLDELIFDPTSLEGSSSFSVVQGVFVFVSGEIAANNPDEMVVRTPVATLGIRGTTVGGNAASEGNLNTVTIIPDGPNNEVTGSITVSTQTSTVTLDTAFQTTAVSSVFEAIAQTIVLSAAQAGGLYGAVGSLLSTGAGPNLGGPTGNDDGGGGGDEGGGGGGGDDGQGAAGDEGGAGGDGEGGGDGGLAAGGDGPGDGEGDVEGGPDDLGPDDLGAGDLGPDGPVDGEFTDGPGPDDPLADGPFADGPAPGEEGFQSGDGAPNEEEIASAGFAAAGDAFDAFEAAFNAGGDLEAAVEAAVVAGQAALTTYLGAAGQEIFETLMEFGPEAAFGDPNFADGIEPPEGFDLDPAQFSDEFAGFEGDFGGEFGPGEFGPGDGPLDPEAFADAFGEEFGGEFGELSPEELAGVAAQFAGEFGDLGPDPFGGPEFGFGGDFVDPFGGDFFGGPGFGFEGGIVDPFGGPVFDPFTGEFIDPFTGEFIDPFFGGEFFAGDEFFDDPFFNDEFFNEDDFFFVSDEEFFGTQTASDVTEFNSTSGGAGVLANSLVGGLSGFTIESSPSPNFVGNTNVGFGSAGTFSSLNFGTSNGTSFSLDAGIVLTSGDGTPNNQNTAILFSELASGSSDSDLDTLLSNTSHVQTTQDSTVLSFSFTVPAGTTAIIFDFMYGTDEFNEQSVNDVAAVFIDGTNFALFPDETILHFDNGLNEERFADNTGGGLNIEYDGISAPDTIVGLISGGGTHTLKIAVSDTSDLAGDSGLFLSAFGLGEQFSNASSGDDILAGTTSPDSVNASTGNDAVFGAAGNDTLSGGDGNDSLDGGSGNDTVNGNNDNDTLDGGPGDDTLSGGAGNDTLEGGFGNDTVLGGANDDTLIGDDGNDLIQGGTGNDILSGDNGNDTLQGNNGNDILRGGAGNDVLEGGDGNDLISGGTGSDNITGGTGIDTMSGGGNSDNFSFTAPSEGQPNASNTTATINGGFHNRISDFTSGTDCFLLTDSAFSLSSLSAGSNFFTIGSQFDGTNTAASGSSPYLVVDSTKTLYYDGNGASGAGYTVLAESAGDAPAITDIVLV